MISRHDTPPESSNAQPARFGLARDAWGQLTLIDAGGQRHANVVPVVMFPISEPKRWIALCEADGREILCVEDPQQLATDVRDLLFEELARREFVPTIERIVSVSGNTEPCQWQVETDRGPTTFVLQSEEDVRRLDAHKVSLVDANRVRYLIPDLRQLDAKSRRIVEWYV